MSDMVVYKYIINFVYLVHTYKFSYFILLFIIIIRYLTQNFTFVIFFHLNVINCKEPRIQLFKHNTFTTITLQY